MIEPEGPGILSRVSWALERNIYISTRINRTRKGKEGPPFSPEIRIWWRSALQSLRGAFNQLALLLSKLASHRAGKPPGGHAGGEEGVRAASLLPAWDLQGQKPHVFPYSPDVKPEASYLALLISMLIKCQSPRENLKEPCCPLCSWGDGHGTASTGSSVPCSESQASISIIPLEWDSGMGKTRAVFSLRRRLTKWKDSELGSYAAFTKSRMFYPPRDAPKPSRDPGRESQRVHFMDEETEASRLSLIQQQLTFVNSFVLRALHKCPIYVSDRPMK